MERLKNYVVLHFEQFFVLIALISIVYINYFIPYKLAFLSFYFLPVLIAGYYLDHRRAILGAFLCIVMAAFYAYVEPESFIMSSEPFDIGLYIFIWGAFLILTGALIGVLQQKLKQEIYQRIMLKDELSESRETLTNVTRELIEQSERLEEEVEKRTEHLQKAKIAIEDHKEKVEEALYSTMDPTVAKLIIEKRLRTEKRNLSIMFADLRSFTEYSEEKAAGLVVTELNRYFGIMERVLLSYRAHIDKYMGDGIMAEFGAPMDYDRHPILAVMAGLKMQEAHRQHGFPWEMRIGIATGEAIIGLIGQNRQAYTALGDVVNMANRIEEVCRPGVVTIDESTYGHVRRFFNTEIRTVQSISRISDPQLAREIEECLSVLEQEPNNVMVLKEAGFLLMSVDDPVQARHYLKSALELDPSDDALKVSFAECSLKIEELQSVTLRGKRRRLHLYEVSGIKDPLLDRNKIPQGIWDAYIDKFNRLGNFPEDIILPVEALDGTIGHSRVVGFLSYAIADSMNLPDKDKVDIALGGYLCDIGKTIVPHHILNRTGSLSREEFEEVKKHCREGVRVLKTMGFENETTFQSILYHHECYDGSGYTEGMAGEDIPIGARIVCVADSYDALTSWRPYRNAWDYTFALSLLGKESGKKKYDPQVMESLEKLLTV
ncbi:MAG: HD domain-containing protein [Deltaproteobacteria bacterium]|nr:HD domain-containing protein [Deltaproteobacteria bacterium]